MLRSGQDARNADSAPPKADSARPDSYVHNYLFSEPGIAGPDAQLIAMADYPAARPASGRWAANVMGSGSLVSLPQGPD
jgi:hypothetical protein